MAGSLPRKDFGFAAQGFQLHETAVHVQLEITPVVGILLHRADIKVYLHAEVWNGSPHPYC